MDHGQNGVILLVILLKKEEYNIEINYFIIKKVIGLNLKLSFFFILSSLQIYYTI
jgi:hypothetical protein